MTVSGCVPCGGSDGKYSEWESAMQVMLMNSDPKATNSKHKSKSKARGQDTGTLGRILDFLKVVLR